ncbi:hypothetical protein ACYZTX_16225 [Pseudomonas sp. MDT1-17]
MTEKKQSTPWKDRPAAEKTALIIGWCVVAFLMVYWFLPSKPAQTAHSQSIASEVQPTTAQYTRASAQALNSATQYLSQLDSAMAEGMHILKANQLPELAAPAFFKVVVASTVQLCRSFLVLLLPIRIQHHRSYRLPVPRLA